MNRWEKVYTQVLAAYVTSNSQHLMDRLLSDSIDSHARCVAALVRTITDAATHEMKLNNLKQGDNE